MPDARFSLDENVSNQLAPLLEAHGHDVRTTRQLGTSGIKDYEQLRQATRQGRILVTHDEDDFRLLHGAWRTWFAEWGTPPLPQHGGILSIPQFPILRVDEAADVLDRFVRSLDAAHGIVNRFFAWSRAEGWREEL